VTVLRQYQQDALVDLRMGWKQGALRQILYSPTGSGKTEMAIELSRGGLAKGRRIGFVVNRVELAVQAARRFYRSGIDCGVVQGDNTRGLDRRLLVCSEQTLSRRGCPDMDMLIIDEAHCTPGSRGFHRLIKSHNACPIIGLTATPFARGMGAHSDELGGPLWQRMVVAATIQDLIRQGFLVDVDIFAPSSPDLSRVRIVAGDYHEGELAAAVDKQELVGDIVRHWQELAPGKKTVCFATSIPHSEHIVEEFLRVGVPAAHIDAYTDDEQRREILQAFADGKLRVISNVSVLAEGWDCPDTEVMILARPTKSLSRYIQMAGRILRPAPGKIRGLILDHSRTSQELGYPTDDLPLILDDGTRKFAEARKASEEARRADGPVKCTSCSFIKPRGTHACPRCGFAPKRQNTVETAEGKLTKLERRKRELEAQAGDVYAQLLWHARDRGYSEGWAWHKTLARCGTVPTDKPEPKPISGEMWSWVKSQQIRYAKGKAKAEVAHAA
jgi:superfamily II DNA or RNA helicase